MREYRTLIVFFNSKNECRLHITPLHSTRLRSTRFHGKLQFHTMQYHAIEWINLRQQANITIALCKLSFNQSIVSIGFEIGLRDSLQLIDKINFDEFNSIRWIQVMSWHCTSRVYPAPTVPCPIWKWMNVEIISVRKSISQSIVSIASDDRITSDRMLSDWVKTTDW